MSTDVATDRTEEFSLFLMFSLRELAIRLVKIVL